jgi:restriction system protein
MDKPLIDARFFGRTRELEWLQRQTSQHGLKPIVLYGQGGTGKSTLLARFAEMSGDYQSPRLWSLPLHPEEAEAILKVNVALLRDEKMPPRVIAVDNADSLSPATIINTTHRILNRKAIRAVVFARRTPIEDELTRGQLLLQPLPAIEAEAFLRAALAKDLPDDTVQGLLTAADGNPLALTLMIRLAQGKTPDQISQIGKGNFYGDGGLIVPSRALLTAARPRIITANEILIQRLQREPEGLYELDSRKFEELVADLMEDMGYEVELTPPSKDGGKDILARLDTPHGKLLCLVEAKRYSRSNPVEVSLVRQLYGTLHDHGATSAMLVTTSRFTRGAKALQERHQYQLALKDYGHVVDWISGYGASRRGV